MKRRKTARRAFSLLELTLVLLIIGVLGAVAAVNVLGQSEKANIRATKATLNVIGNAVTQYIMDNAVAPESIQVLVTDGTSVQSRMGVSQGADVQPSVSNRPGQLELLAEQGGGVIPVEIRVLFRQRFSVVDPGSFPGTGLQ